ncbi:unnamed protein product [Trichogramma brassicae]|uniref:Integrase zinc-binding domain-containing protein n=1 Tax=Trichogramma brassicae TaxID=86971 RepID=A0A6H5IL02_9HYME|nr:unnamed protein product [Trichogramma brassicae]
MMPPEATPQQQSTPPRLILMDITKPLVEEIKEEQQKDPAHTYIAKQCVLGRSQRYRIAEEGLWYFDQRQDKWKLSVPKDAKPRVLHDFHDAAGHPEEDETYRAISNRFYWPNIQKDVRNHVKLCRISGKKSKTSSADIRPHQPKEPWNTIAVDFMGPFSHHCKKKKIHLSLYRPLQSLDRSLPDGHIRYSETSRGGTGRPRRFPGRLPPSRPRADAWNPVVLYPFLASQTPSIECAYSLSA